MKYQPLADRVIVERHEMEEVTKGGIVLAGVNEKPMRGTVLAVGPGRWLGPHQIKPTVKEGDIVLFGKSAGEEIEVSDKETILVLREQEILATIDG